MSFALLTVAAFMLTTLIAPFGATPIQMDTNIGYLGDTDTECPNISQNDITTHEVNTLRVVQYNAEWLYIDHCDSFDCPGSQCTWKNTSDAEIHLSYVVSALNTLNPDIINFCEVEGCDELQMVINQLDMTTTIDDNTVANYNCYLKKGTDTSTGQNVGMISRYSPTTNLFRTEDRVSYPVPNSQCGSTQEGSSGVSKHYITEFSFNGMDIAFISVHFIAIPTDPERCLQREAQAQVIQNMVAEYIKNGYEVLLVGDMNDFDGSIPDINSNMPISNVLATLKGEAGTYASEYALHSVGEKIDQCDRYSDWWDSDNDCSTASVNDYSMIDHVLLTPMLYSYVSDVKVYHDYDEYCGKYDSDHYPVVVDFVF